jgi:cysteine desulfuration protein SufE
MSVSTITSPLERQRRQRLAPLLQLGDAQARLARLVEEARRLPALAPARRVDANRVEGCLVRVWFLAERRDGRCFFECDSDAVSLKAVGGLLCELYSGFTAEEILPAPSNVLEPLKILHQLAENRQRTIARIEEKIRGFAQQQKAK